MKILKILFSIFILMSIGITKTTSCSLPPDIIHEFRINTASDGNMRVTYTLMAWRSLHENILGNIEESNKIKYIVDSIVSKDSQLEFNSKKATFTYLTGGIIYHNGNTSVSDGIENIYNPEPLMVIEFETNIPANITKSTQIELEFHKQTFVEITSLIHAYVYTDIQKYGQEKGFKVGNDDKSYFPYVFENKEYAIRNNLTETNTKNTFELFIEPIDGSELFVANSVSQIENKDLKENIKDWTNIGGILQGFFIEKNNRTVQAIGLLIAIFAGILHGLLPGHSKTLIGTYMINNSVLRYKEIGVLILSVTSSHTVFIFILATIALALQKGLSMMTVYITTISAIGYIIFGIYFYVQGNKKLREITHKKSIFHTKSIIDNHCNCNPELPGKNSIKGTMLTGILAGCNPCIDALALFIFAITIGNAGYAFLMIISFSLGLGLMLAILAIFVKKSKVLLQKKSQEFAEKITAMITIIAGVVVILIGSSILIL